MGVVKGRMDTVLMRAVGGGIVPGLLGRRRGGCGVLMVEIMLLGGQPARVLVRVHIRGRGGSPNRFGWSARTAGKSPGVSGRRYRAKERRRRGARGSAQPEGGDRKTRKLVSRVRSVDGRGPRWWGGTRERTRSRALSRAGASHLSPAQGTIVP